MNGHPRAPLVAVVLLAAMLVSPTLSAQPTDPYPDLAVTGVKVLGEQTPQWIEGEAVPATVEVQATINNAGGSDAWGYRLDYYWVDGAGRSTYLNGNELSSFDVWDGGPLGPKQSRDHHPIEWVVQPDQRGLGSLRVVLTPAGYDHHADNNQIVRPVDVKVHDIDLSVPGPQQPLRDPSETRFLPVRVTNNGTVPEVVALSVAAETVQPADRSTDVMASLQYTSLIVQPGETKESTLFVDYLFSGDTGDFTARYDIEATTTYGRVVTASSPLFVSTGGQPTPDSLALVDRADALPLMVPQSGAVTRKFLVSNVGPHEDTYRVGPSTAPGWTATVGLEGLDDAAFVRIALGPGDSTPVRMTLHAAEDAVRGTPTEAGIRVQSDRPTDPQQQQWPAEPVDRTWPFRVHGPAVRFDPAPGWDLQPYQGDPVRAAVVVHNDGDEPTPDASLLRLAVTGAQETTATRGAPAVPAGAQHGLEILAQVNHAGAGPVIFKIDWQGPGATPFHQEPLRVEGFVRVPLVTIAAAEGMEGMPGQTLQYRTGDHAFVVHNDGNAEETFTVAAHAEAGAVHVVIDPVFTLAPGDNRTVAFDHHLPIPSGSRTQVNVTLEVAIDGRPDLNWNATAATRIIDRASPVVTRPTLPAQWALGGTLPVRVNVTDDSAVATVDVVHVLPGGNAKTHAMTLDPDQTGAWLAELLLAAPGDHLFRFVAHDLHGNNASVEAGPVAVHVIPAPTLALEGPAEGETVSPGTTYRVNASDVRPVTRVNVTVRDAAGALIWAADLDLAQHAPAFNLTAIPNGPLTITLDAWNDAGATARVVRNVTMAGQPNPDVDPVTDSGVEPGDDGRFTPSPPVAAVLMALVALAERIRRGGRSPLARGRAANRHSRAPRGGTRHASAPRARVAPALSALILVAAAVLFVPVPAHADDVNPVQLEWWGDTTIGEGFHLRIPVSVTNHRDHDVDNGAVLAEVDITRKLIEAGWVSQARSGEDLLRLFELDEASVRVVAMTDLEPMSSTSIHGRLGLSSKQFPPGDLRRHEVPSTSFEGFLTDSGAGDFQATTNPIITVLWRVPGVLPPGEERHFMIYFDSTLNADDAADQHTPPDYTGVPGADLLERTFWSGPGLDLVGFVTPGAGSPGLATVIGLHDDTTVEVLVAGDDGSFTKQSPAATHDNPFVIDGEAFRSVFISNTHGTPFRLVADKPILALVHSEGFVPTMSGGIVASAGDSFLFSTTHAAALDQDGLYFFNLNPDPAQTVQIQVDRLDNDIDDRTVFLSGGAGTNQNHWPYTIGRQATVTGDGNCNPPASGRMAPITPGRGNFRVDVVSGGPVALQYSPALGVTQLPAADGRPLGTTFWTATSKTNCSGVTQQNHFYAIAPSATDLGVYPPHPNEVPQARLFPACAQEPCGAGQPIGPLPDGAFLRQAFTGLDGIRDRPARIETGATTWLMTGPGPIPASLDAVPLRGPLGGGDAGRVFAGVGSTVGGRSEPAYIYSPFAGTKVLADIHYTASPATDDLPIHLLAERIQSLPGRTGDPIRSYDLASDRPIIVLPRGAAPGFLAGMPVTLEATVHGADYRGHLVDLRSITGLDPVSDSTLAGQPITYTFEVTNLGRKAGAENLPDNVRMQITGRPDGWTTRFSQDAFRLQSGESKTVQLTVTPPADAPTGSLTPIHVHALSQSGIGRSVEVNTLIKSEYGVGIWFDGVLGGKVDEASAPRGSPINYTVVVQNLGSVPDTIRLDVAPRDWDARLLNGALPVSSLALPAKDDPGSVVELQLQVTPPEEGRDGFLQTTVTASSLKSPAKEDKVFAISKVRAPSDLALEMGDRTVWVGPNGTAQFNFTLRNDGAGGAEAFFELRSDLLDGWTQPEVFLRTSSSSSDGSLIPFPSHPPRLSIGEDGERVPLAVVLQAAPDALAGDQVSTRLQVSAMDQEINLEAFLRTIVAPVHHLEVVAPDVAARVAVGGTPVTIDLRVTNAGNLDEWIMPTAAALPAGWSLSFPAEAVLLPRGATQVLEVGVLAPVGVAAGLYEVVVAMVSEDGALTEVVLPVDVGAFAAHASAGSGRLLGQPGQAVWTTHEIRNDGNTVLKASLESVAGEPWALAPSGTTYLIPPGANVTVPVGWVIPRAAADGVSVHAARIVLRPEVLSVDVVHESVAAEVEVGRADLVVVAASTFQGPAAKIVHATIGNHGVRTAHDVVVQLRAGADVVDEVTIATLPAGSERNVTLLRPDGQDGSSVLVLDPGDLVVESKANNILNVDAVQDSPVALAPAPGAWALLGALLVLAIALRRPPRGPESPPNGHATTRNAVFAPMTQPLCGGGCGDAAGKLDGGRQT